jgi:hypothetical protein
METYLAQFGVQEIDYRYHWMVVNSRCFLWEYAIARRKPKLQVNRDDCLALVPWGDYFNHTDREEDGFKVSMNPTGFIVTARKDYAGGDEVLGSYGSHRNDYLFAEYGFTMNTNVHEYIQLDEVIFRHLDPSQTRLLQDMGYYGKYSLYGPDLASQSVANLRINCCFRTEIALAAMLWPPRRVRQLSTRAGNLDISAQSGFRDKWFDIVQVLRDDMTSKLHQLRERSFSGEAIPTSLLGIWTNKVDFLNNVLNHTHVHNDMSL